MRKINVTENSTSLLSYSYTDLKSLDRINYYRLKETDFSGRFKFSEIIEVENCELISNEVLLDISPNPSNGIFNCSLNREYGLFISIALFNISGKQVYYSEDFKSTLDLSYMPSGMYFVKFISEKNSITKKIIIEK